MEKWAKLAVFDFDAYADLSGLNSQATGFGSSIDPPSSSRVLDRTVWAFPPPLQAAEFSKEWAGWDADIVAVVPIERWVTVGRCFRSTRWTRLCASTEWGESGCSARTWG